MSKTPPPEQSDWPPLTVTDCVFIAVGRQTWNPAISMTREGVEVAHSVIASPELLKWRYFLQYKTRNVSRNLRRLFTKETI